MRLYYSLAVIFLTLVMAGCSQEESADMVMAEPAYAPEIKAAEAQRGKSKYLAYTHRVSIDLPVNKVEAKYNQLLAWCAADTEYQCTMLDSRLTTDNYVQAQVEFRILPNGVAEILGIAYEGGATTHKSTSIEDLGEAIVDNQKRLEMLRDYRSRLEALSKKSDADVESLVKIAAEMSKVQSDLEYAEGKRNKLLQRVEMDIVNISLSSRSQKSFFQPIGSSLKNFSSRLSEGISDTIIAIAYLIPWFLLVIAVLLFVRKIWAWVRNK